MLKTIKGRVVAGVAAVLLLVGGTAALGASNAGEKFQEWYNKLFKQHAEMVQVGVEDHVKNLDLRDEYQVIKDNAENQINDTGKTATEASNKNINSQRDEHIDAIKRQHEEISKYMDEQFGELVKTAANGINEAGEAALAYAKDDMGTHTDTVGKEALESLNKDLKATTEKALSDIEEAIRLAKWDIEHQIGQKVVTTKAEIIKLIDAKVVELRKAINAETKSLVAAQVKIINTDAKFRLIEAKSEMEKLVNSINK